MKLYLSHLLIDVGDNPDRPRPGRLWLRNLYHVHQRLCMAFPSNTQKFTDKYSLKPFDPDNFGEDQVHVPRKENSGFLFRIDPQHNGRAVILVQSAIEPDWEYAFQNALYLLAAPPETKDYEPSFKSSQRLRFRLVVNPTRRLSKNSPDVKEKSIGKRVPVPNDKLIDWLIRRGDAGGFLIDEGSTIIHEGYIYMQKKQKGDERVHLRSVRYDGVLTVTNCNKFYNTLISGIGSGKAFGFGLLSVVGEK